MYISKVRIENFRLLRDSTLDLRKNLSLLVGKNNTGKTSLLVLFEKFFQPKSFHYNDFPLALREQIHSLNKDTEVDDLSIRMVLEVQYDENDNLENLSEFILDLDPEIKTVKILFECTIQKERLLKIMSGIEGDERKKIIIKNIDQHLKSRIYVFDDSGHEGENDFFKVNRHKFIEKELKDIKNLINLHIIHARRNVSSSEESNVSKKPLSAITTSYFNSNSEQEVPNEDLLKINKILVEMDDALDKSYESFFKDFLKNAKNFLNLEKLSVVSNIQSKMLFDNSSQVIYGSGDSHLPEHLNGLGYMNILYLLLQIEIKKEDFKNQNKDINLLFIEEPEAHTHPQMQYIFASEINSVLKEMKNLQTLITSHSSHIVSQSNFEDIRYLKLSNNGTVTKYQIEKVGLEWSEVSKKLIKNDWAEQINSAKVHLAANIGGEADRMLGVFGENFSKILPILQQTNNDNVEIKNFHTELNEKYSSEPDQFQFLKQYLNIQSAELFFASKIIFIEGITERMLLPYFIQKFDEENAQGKDDYISLASQNISILEVGANAKAFAPFLEFLGIKTLIITDIDTTNKNDNGKSKPVIDPDSNCTSNATLRYFLSSPQDVQSNEFSEWFDNLRNHLLNSVHSNIKVTYQKEENIYHARSFEDAFISSNKEEVKSKKAVIMGLKNREELDTNEDMYDLTNKILDKKSDFAASLLYQALSNDEIQWETPLYIKDGLLWIWEQEL